MWSLRLMSEPGEIPFRKHIQVHSKYSTLEPWDGIKMASIRYGDTEDEMTSLLIQRSCCPDERARQSHYIGVKTTTGSWSETFCMSKVTLRASKLRSCSLTNTLRKARISFGQ